MPDEDLILDLGLNVDLQIEFIGWFALFFELGQGLKLQWAGFRVTSVVSGSSSSGWEHTNVCACLCASQNLIHSGDPHACICKPCF